MSIKSELIKTITYVQDIKHAIIYRSGEISATTMQKYDLEADKE